MSEVLSFDKAVEMMGDGYFVQKNLLFGNGASIEWSGGSMHYDKLYEASGLASNKQINQLFQLAGSYNFEEVLEKLQNSEQVCSILGVAGVSAVVRRTENTIKQAFLTAIYRSHNKQDENWPIRAPVEAECDACYDFLSRFDQVFTVNYDLLPSSVLAYGASKHRGEKIRKDGFSCQNEDGNHFNFRCIDCNFWYLHGGLHLYENERGVYKLVKSGELSLGDKVSKKLRNNTSPIIVCGGSGKSKMAYISSKPYLKTAFDTLSHIGGSLMIYGHSLSDYDRHIFEAVNKSPGIDTIFYCDVNADGNAERLTALLKDRFPDKNTHIVRADSVPFWGNSETTKTSPLT